MPRDRSLLVDAVAAMAGVAPGTVWIETVCARCASAEHGRPVVHAPLGPGGALFQVSLSRAGGMVGVAVSGGVSGAQTGAQPGAAPSFVSARAPAGSPAGIGLDLTRVADVARASIDAALHPAESAAVHALPPHRQNERRALLWAAKEAVLKAAGIGLNADPALLQLQVEPDGTVSVVGFPSQPAFHTAPRITTFALPGGLVGALATLGSEPPDIRFVTLPPAAVTDG